MCHSHTIEDWHWIVVQCRCSANKKWNYKTEIMDFFWEGALSVQLQTMSLQWTDALYNRGTVKYTWWVELATMQHLNDAKWLAYVHYVSINGPIGQRQLIGWDVGRSWRNLTRSQWYAKHAGSRSKDQTADLFYPPCRTSLTWRTFDCFQFS